MRKLTIALSGNPNSGKSTIFNAITGARQHIANYPGVTVEKKYGRVTHNGCDIEVVDLPGTYSLTAYSLEEIVARDFLVQERPDVVVDILDASNLDRNLYLAVQFKELGVPLILALNMVDVATSRGIEIDQKILATLFEAPVVPTVARTKTGIKDLLDKIVEVAPGDHDWRPNLLSYGIDIDQSIEEIETVIKAVGTFSKQYSPKWLALKCLEDDNQIIALINGDPRVGPAVGKICSRVSKHTMNTLEEEPEGIIADHRYGYIAGITKKAIRRKIAFRVNLSDRIDKVLTNRIVGPVFMMAVLYGIYAFTFWASETPVAWCERFFEWLKGILAVLLPAGNLQSLIVSGIIDGVGGVLGFVPLIMFMFFAIAIMEDSGYLARVAYMLDRVLRWFGLHGSSVMALLISGGISGGCAVPGVMATRTLRDPKERIATLLVVPFMNCGAKLPVFGMLIAAFFQKNEARMLFVFTLLSWTFALFAAKVIRSTVLKGPKTPFVMELPPYRVPTGKGLVIHTWERTWQYIKKAGTIILGISIILWAMMRFPALPEDQKQAYENQRIALRTAFLTSPDAETTINNEKDLAALDDLYKQKMGDIDRREQADALKRTVAGRIGRSFEGISKTIGFDYRTNIALVGGFVAKEVIVSTLGTAYSLGEVDPEKGVTFSERLRKDPNWNPLKAFTLILFTMLYVPCFVTLISIKRESSWKWAGFSVIFNLIAAYLVCLIVYQTGSALGLGL